MINDPVKRKEVILVVPLIWGGGALKVVKEKERKGGGILDPNL